MFYRDAQAAMVVFDVTSRQSFEQAQWWIDELRHKAPPGAVIALVCNATVFVDDGPTLLRVVMLRWVTKWTRLAER